jgi:hypothetical protein
MGFKGRALYNPSGKAALQKISGYKNSDLDKYFVECNFNIFNHERI